LIFHHNVTVNVHGNDFKNQKTVKPNDEFLKIMAEEDFTLDRLATVGPFTGITAAAVLNYGSFHRASRYQVIDPFRLLPQKITNHSVEVVSNSGLHWLSVAEQFDYQTPSSGLITQGCHPGEHRSHITLAPDLLKVVYGQPDILNRYKKLLTKHAILTRLLATKTV
jgi:hypothetical protein